MNIYTHIPLQKILCHLKKGIVTYTTTWMYSEDMLNECVYNTI